MTPYPRRKVPTRMPRKLKWVMALRSIPKSLSLTRPDLRTVASNLPHRSTPFRLFPRKADPFLPHQAPSPVRDISRRLSTIPPFPRHHHRALLPCQERRCRHRPSWRDRIYRRPLFRQSRILRDSALGLLSQLSRHPRNRRRRRRPRRLPLRFWRKSSVGAPLRRRSLASAFPPAPSLS